MLLARAGSIGANYASSCPGESGCVSSVVTINSNNGECP